MGSKRGLQDEDIVVFLSIYGIKGKAYKFLHTLEDLEVLTYCEIKQRCIDKHIGKNTKYPYELL